jgi:flagellar biosynthesis/type III secretory pathway protein FliH
LPGYGYTEADQEYGKALMAFRDKLTSTEYNRLTELIANRVAQRGTSEFERGKAFGYRKGYDDGYAIAMQDQASMERHE